MKTRLTPGRVCALGLALLSGACGAPEYYAPLPRTTADRYQMGSGPRLQLVEQPDPSFHDVLRLGSRTFVILADTENTPLAAPDTFDVCANPEAWSEVMGAGVAARGRCRDVFASPFEIAPLGDAPDVELRIASDACASLPLARVQLQTVGPPAFAVHALEVERCTEGSAPLPLWTFARSNGGRLSRATLIDPGAESAYRVECDDRQPRRCLVLRSPPRPSRSLHVGLVRDDLLVGESIVSEHRVSDAAVYVEEDAGMLLELVNCRGPSILRVGDRGTAVVHQGRFLTPTPTLDCGSHLPGASRADNAR